MSKFLCFLLLICAICAYVPPCSELTDIPGSFNDLVPLGFSEGKSEIHIYRKYFITKRGSGNSNENVFSKTVWTLDVDKDMLLRMRVQSPNTNFKISLTTESGNILADAASVMEFGASISSLISKDKLDGSSKVNINFYFYDFLKTPEEVIEHEDVHDCHLPHIVLELSVMSKEEFISRKIKFNKDFPADTPESWPVLENDALGYSGDNEQSSKVSNGDNIYSLTKTESENQGKFQILKEYHFTIDSQMQREKDPNAQELLYYLQLVLTYDFMTSGSMHIVVAHQKDGINTQQQLFQYDSLNCAETMTCVVSKKTAKNEESFHIALTEGDYVLYFIDYQNEGMRNFIAESVPKIPFSSVMYFYPVESQDNSIYCDGLSIPNPYFVPYEISEKTLFDQKIEMDLRNSSQSLYFNVNIQNPIYVRFTTEQDLGMDVDVKIYSNDNKLLAEGKDIGSTETVAFLVQQSMLLKVELKYRNSIIRDLSSCPQLHFYLSSISDKKVEEVKNKQAELLSNDHNTYEKIEKVIADMQTAIDSGQSYTNVDDFDFIYVFYRESVDNLEENIYQNKLVNSQNQAYWMYFEIFCDEVFNDVVVDIDYEDKRFTRTSSIEQKLSTGQTDQLLRSQKALHVFSMVMSYQDSYDIKFLSRNVLGAINQFNDTLKHVMFQMRVHINPIGKQIPLTMTSLLIPTFNNLRDLGIQGMKYSEMNFNRERILLANYDQNKVTLTPQKGSKMRIYLKSLVNGVSINDIFILNGEQKLTGTVIEKTFGEYDISFTFPEQKEYTLVIETRAKKKSFSDFFMKLEVQSSPRKSACTESKMPNFNEIAIKAKRSDTTQESHYYVGNQLFRNIYHLGQRQIGVPRSISQVSLPSSDGKNYAVIPFSLTSSSNLVTVNMFHDWPEFLTKMYILPKNEDPKDLYDIIRDQKRTGDHSNINDVDSIFQSRTMEFFDSIEKQFLPMGDYQLVIMNMDPSTDTNTPSCMKFTLSVYVEEILKKKESRTTTGMLVQSWGEGGDAEDEAVIETMTLCQHTFIYDEIYRNPLKVNGGVLSIDSIYRVDNDERKKRIVFEIDTNSVIYIQITDIYGQIISLEASLNVVQPRKDNPWQEDVKIVQNKKSEQKRFQSIEIQQFVKKGKYILDFWKSVFDVDTDMFPCNRLKFEIEIRPLRDIPNALKTQETCPEINTKQLIVPTIADPSQYNKIVREDGYYPITQKVMKNFRFKVTEPMFLALSANFEKELSGGSYNIAVGRVNSLESKGNQGNDQNVIPTLFNQDSFDGTVFIHQRLDPSLSGDMKLDTAGEYVVSIQGQHEAKLSMKMQKNDFIPRCSKVSFYYQLLKISEIEQTYDEEFSASTGSIDAAGDNCKNVAIDTIQTVVQLVHNLRNHNSMDFTTKLSIPDPLTKKKIGFVLRSLNKPTLSIVRIAASLPQEVRQSSNLKFHLKVTKKNEKEDENLTISETLGMHEKEISFLIDDIEDINYFVTIEFEEIDFELLQTLCSYIELRVIREPALDVLTTLMDFDSEKYQDLATLKTKPRTFTIDKQGAKRISFYQSKSSALSQKNKVIGRVTLEVKANQAQVDILAEYNYAASSVEVEIYGEDQFTDNGIMEITDEHYKENALYTARNAIRMIGTGDMLKKGTYTLLIKSGMYSKNLLKGFQVHDIPVDDDIKFPITIRVQSTLATPDAQHEGDFRIIDIEFNGDPDDNGKAINTLEDLSIVLEFNDNLDNSKVELGKDQPFAVLSLDSGYHKGAKKNKMTKIEPSKIDRTSVISENMIQLIWEKKTLKKGATYTLELDSNIAVNPDLKDQDYFTIKTLSSGCNPKGTLQNKNGGKGCRCKFPYKGPTCNECQDKYHYNPLTQECVIFETCSNDICNNHGQCIIDNTSGTAKCICEPGFKSDSEGAQCAECVNEDQAYPKCSISTRQGLSKSSCFVGQNYLVPRYLKDSSSLWTEKVGDVREFVREYSLRKAVETETLDMPVFDETTVVKIFFKGSEGLSCRMKILDSKDNILFESKQLYNTGSFTAILDPSVDKETGEINEEKAHIIFEYQKNSTLSDKEKKEGSIDCWSNEVVVSMNPYTELIQNSKCEAVKDSEFTPKISKTENRLFDIYEFNLTNPININERLILENSKLKVKLTHDSTHYSKDQHGVLLVMVHYDFAFVSMNSKLNMLENKKKKFLAYGKTESFEDQLRTEASMTQMANVIKYKIPASFYEKQSSSLEAEFSLTDKFISIYENSQLDDETCWPINMIIEYIPPGQGANKPRDDDDESHAMIEMITPASLDNIIISDQQNLTVHLSFDTSITEAYPGLDTSSSLAGTLLQQMCVIESHEETAFTYFMVDIMGFFDKTGTIFPMQYILSQNHKDVTLIFNIRQVFEDSCYTLACKRDPTVIDGTYYRVNETTGIDTKYCFGKERSQAKSNSMCDKCNPLGTYNCNSKGKCKCSHPYTGDNCDQCVNGYEISTQFNDGNHKCVKSNKKCSPEFCNFKGACELKSIKGKQVPTCKCKENYAGNNCNQCKNPDMQFPGCHTPKTNELISDSAKELMSTYSRLNKNQGQQKCENSIPPTFDTFEHIRYNGEVSLSGVYSISEINSEISLTGLNKDSLDYKTCLFGASGTNLRIYLEFLEESYITRRIPITVADIQGNEESVLAESTPVYLPGKQESILRGEFLEIDLSNNFNNLQQALRIIKFKLGEVFAKEANVLTNGCLEVYLEISMMPKDSFDFNDAKCEKDHENPLVDEQFANKEVLKVKPGFDYSSVADPNTYKFNEKSFFYKESDGEFFHQKDIELVDEQIQNIDFELLQNFQTSSHLLGMIIEAPFEGNHDAFMHGGSEPNCESNECIYGEKVFNGQYISYIFNSNIVSRIRLWFYKIHTLPSSEFHKVCTSYHFTIKSSKNYMDLHTKEKVACPSESFPPVLTSRRFAHKEIPDSYIVDDSFRIDSFTDISFSASSNAESHLSSIFVEKPSLLKVIVRNEELILGYEVTVYKNDNGVTNHIYTSNTLESNAGKSSPPDFRVTLTLPKGHYSLRIRAVLKGFDMYYKTCDTVRVYAGITPIDNIDIPVLMNAQDKIPDLGYLLGSNQTVNVKLPDQVPVEFQNKDLISNPYYNLYNTTIEYSGDSGDIGLYLEIGENLDSSLCEEISEITASVYPDLKVLSNDTSSVPLISTSGGKTFMHIMKLVPGNKYQINLLREKILQIEKSRNIPSNLQLSAKLYSLDKLGDIVHAKVTIGDRLLSIPVSSWMPACFEEVLTDSVFQKAITNVLKSGIQYEETLVLNENIKRINSGTISLKNMKSKEGTLMISVSPYELKAEGVLEEFMITSVAKGSKKTIARSQEFEENIYLLNIDLSKNNHNDLGMRINYAVAQNSVGNGIFADHSQCSMIRLSIQFIPSNKQAERSECSSGTFESNIGSVIPSILPDSTLTHQEDQIISYEYSTLSSKNQKFKVNPYKPEQNRIKFKIKKPSTFRFEAIAYPCYSSPIERTIVLKSVSKTHNQITSDIIQVGVPSTGNSILLYVEELMPGSYKLELDYGWISDFTPGEKSSDEELMDFKVEIYSHYQNENSYSLMHNKDRHLKMIENAVRDLSVVNFMDRKSGQYIAEEMPLPTHPINKGVPVNIPFKILHEKAQVIISSEKNFTYIDNIKVMKKETKSIIRTLSNLETLEMSEVLQKGEYLLQFNYKPEEERSHNPAIQYVIFGISDYQSLDVYKKCNAKLLDKCMNGLLTESLLMMKGTDGNAVLDIEADQTELLSLQLHYNHFLAQRPLKIYLDDNQQAIKNVDLKNMVINKGNHSLRIFGPKQTLDATCLLISFVEYETPITSLDISTMPGITPDVGVQTLYFSSLKKGTSQLPLPSFKDNINDTLFISTLLLHFDSKNQIMNSQNIVELDLNFDIEKEFNFVSQIYYEASKDKIISYIDIADVKPSADVNKQFLVVHTADSKTSQYTAHYVVANGNTIANSLDQCNTQKNLGTAQALSENSSFYYNDMGIEEFTVAITKDVVSTPSKFYDSASDVFYIEVIYEITQPAFIEVVCEFDISMQNVDMYIFKDFNDEITLEDQEIAGSTLEIPTLIESTISRHTSVYLSHPGKYSVFIIDKKLPMIFKHLGTFEGEDPCALLKVTHSVQPFSPQKLVASSIGFLSSWPRRISLGDPYFVTATKNLEVDIFPNTIEISKKDIPDIKFTVIDLQTQKKLYNISPDKISISVPMRKVSMASGLSKYVKEIRIKCFFKSSTLKNVIGQGRILTIADPDSFSDKTLVPYFIIIDGTDDEAQLEEMKIQPNATSSPKVKDKMNLKQQRQERAQSISKITKCNQACKNGDCNQTGTCICRPGWTGANCDQKKKVGKLDKIKQKQLIQAQKNQQKNQNQQQGDLDEDYDDDDEGMLDEISISTPQNKPTKVLESNTKSTDKKSNSYQYGWFDIFLFFCLLTGIGIIFYQKLWSGRFCRKKFYKKLKYEEDDDKDEQEVPVINEDMEFIGESLEMPRIRKKKD